MIPVAGFPVEGRKPPERCPFGRFFYVWKGIVVCGLLGWQGGKRCKKMVMRLGESLPCVPLLPERLGGDGDGGSCLEAMPQGKNSAPYVVIPRSLSASCRVHGDGAGDPGAGRDDRNPRRDCGASPSRRMRPCDGRLLSVVKATTSGSSRTLKAQPITLRAASRRTPCPSIRAGTASRFPRRA